MQVKIMLLRNALIGSSILGLVACTSVNNENIVEDEVYEIEDVVQTNSAVYSCNQKPLNVYFHAEQAKVIWEKQSYILNHAVSASGSFYLGEELSFWIHGEKAELKMNEMKDIQCRLVRIDS
jgi:membrane-bound inhibitor of C-type lysozyme